MRRQEEFYCHECSSYFLTYLRTNFTGNYTIECPSCGHFHFRFISEGLVTDDRHNKKYGESEIIVGLKSTLKKEPYHNDPVFRRSQMKAYGLHT
jgi:DNA-directed RNA polymerase subunit RPC12/RpoP